MRKILSVVVGAALLATASTGVAGASQAERDDVVVLKQQDRTGDVKVEQEGKKVQKAPRRIKQSVDIGRVIYRIDRELTTPSLIVTTEARNVLPANHAYKQRFRTDIDDYNYFFTYFWADGAGDVTVRYLDRGGDVKVPCPDATVQLRPAKEQVVQTIPLSCIQLGGSDLHFFTTASIVPKGPKWFVAADRTRRTTGIDVEPLFEAARATAGG